MLQVVFNSILLVCVAFQLNAQQAGAFKTYQLKQPRVKKAYESKFESLKTELRTKGFKSDDFEVFLRVFKHEKELQVWLKEKGNSSYRHFKTYPICASSGELGPKRKEGDNQVPEGFYEIQHFNPASSYHLSLKVNYPNKSDMKKAKGRPGGDIMIHGECVTIGCIPIENDPIEELYILCVESFDRKHKISLDIFPFKFTAENDKTIGSGYSKELNDFWKTLKPGYTYFEENKKAAKVSVDKNGNYEVVK